MARLTTNGRPWVFYQLGPPNRTFRLEGASAPHGRPRKKPIMETELEVRQTETFVAGQRAPIRHITGDKESPIVLTGRLSDRTLGPGGAQDKRKEIRIFFAEAIQTLVTWGQILTYRCTPGRAKFGIESQAEFSYELELKVDEDCDLVVNSPSTISSTSPKSTIPRVIDSEATIRSLIVPRVRGSGVLNPEFFDAFENTVSLLNSASAELLSASTFVDDFASATTSNIRRLIGGIHQYETALLRIDQTLSTFACDTAVSARSARNDIDFYRERAEALETMADVRSLLSRMRSEGEAQSRGSIIRSIVAVQGDSWESIAAREIGSPSKAQAIRDANGILGGDIPIPGRKYVIPVDS